MSINELDTKRLRLLGAVAAVWDHADSNVTRCAIKALDEAYTDGEQLEAATKAKPSIAELGFYAKSGNSFRVNGGKLEFQYNGCNKWMAANWPVDLGCYRDFVEWVHTRCRELGVPVPGEPEAKPIEPAPIPTASKAVIRKLSMAHDEILQHDLGYGSPRRHNVLEAIRESIAQLESGECEECQRLTNNATVLRRTIDMLSKRIAKVEAERDELKKQLAAAPSLEAAIEHVAMACGPHTWIECGIHSDVDLCCSIRHNNGDVDQVSISPKKAAALLRPQPPTKPAMSKRDEAIGTLRKLVSDYGSPYHNEAIDVLGGKEQS